MPEAIDPDDWPGPDPCLRADRQSRGPDARLHIHCAGDATPTADRQALLQVLYRLAQLAADFPQFAEIEINPMRVLPTGEGALAVDVRLRLAEV